MSNAQGAGGGVGAENIVAELQRVVQLVPPATLSVGDDELAYEQLYVEEVSAWLDNCMIFGRELARVENVRFESNTPRQPADMSWFIRYLGACDAWLDALLAALRSGTEQPSHDSKHGANRGSEHQQRLRNLASQLERVISTLPTYLRLVNEEQDSQPSLVIRWTLVCAEHVAQKLAEQGIRSRIGLPQWSGETERFMGALDTWLTMIYEALDRQLEPVAA